MKGVTAMKKSNLFSGMLFLLAGAVLVCAARLSESVLSGLLISFGAACIFSGMVTTCKYFYWSAPKNKERYQEKIENEKIELHDELKTKLRDRSGRYAYVIGLATISVSIVIFAILGKLEIIGGSRIIVLFLGSYLLFQIIVGIAIFAFLLKEYR